MKKIFLLITTLLLFIIPAQATQMNYLHTIVLESTDDGYNVVLNSDTVPSVKKSTKGADKIVLTLKDVTASDNLNAIYRGTSEVNSLVIETISAYEIKIYIHAKNIMNSTIMAKTTDGNQTIISERFPIEKTVWTLCVLLILALLFKSAKSVADYENSIVIKKDIKDREIELYRNFQKELNNMPKINSKINNSYATNIMPRSRRNYKELARR